MAGYASDGVVTVKSAYGMDETIRRIKDDIAGKKIMFFAQIDQAKLAADAGIALRPSTQLIFGNPPRHARPAVLRAGHVVVQLRPLAQAANPIYDAAIRGGSP